MFDKTNYNTFKYLIICLLEYRYIKQYYIENKVYFNSSYLLII